MRHTVRLSSLSEENLDIFKRGFANSHTDKNYEFIP